MIRLVALALVCACAVAPPKPLGVGTGWAAGRVIYVGNGVTQVPSRLLHPLAPLGGTLLAAPQELNSIRFCVVRKPPPEAIEMDFVWEQPSRLRAKFRNAGHVLGDFTADVDGDHLECYT
ncbi:MAG: hypothetical protein ABR567_10575, partial [Myxococcales bacterium]